MGGWQHHHNNEVNNDAKFAELLQVLDATKQVASPRYHRRFKVNNARLAVRTWYTHRKIQRILPRQPMRTNYRPPNRPHGTAVDTTLFFTQDRMLGSRIHLACTPSTSTFVTMVHTPWRVCSSESPSFALSFVSLLAAVIQGHAASTYTAHDRKRAQEQSCRDRARATVLRARRGKNRIRQGMEAAGERAGTAEDKTKFHIACRYIARRTSLDRSLIAMKRIACRVLTTEQQP
nr:hypothetical protein CFP56_11630 [Quercus suber]